MKTIKVLLPYLFTTAVILILMYFLGREADRIRSNFQTAIEANNSQYYQLTRAEFKEFEKELKDSLYFRLKDSLNIKIRHIERTIKHEYRYTYDTTKTVLITHENSPYLHFSKIMDNCLTISGHVQDTMIYFDNVTIDYEAETIYFWKRKHKILGIPIGKRTDWVETLNKCTGESKVTEIEINKR